MGHAVPPETMPAPGRALMRGLSVLGDSALLVPLSLLLLAYLAARAGPAAARAWLVTLLGSTGLTLVLKLAFRTCGAALVSPDAISPSGHASFAVTVYGALAILLASRRRLAVRLAAAAAAIVLAGAVAWSRVAIGVHSGLEVLIGVGVGLAALALFASLHAAAGRPGISARHAAVAFALLVAGALLLAASGRHLSLEPLIARLGDRLAPLVETCAETRPPPRSPRRP